MQYSQNIAYSHFFPALRQVCRTTFARQAANLMAVKARLWRMIVHSLELNSLLWRVDSVSIRVCRFARARDCRRFAGLAAFGYDETAEHTFFGFRAHLCVDEYGVIRAFTVAPANAHDLAPVPELVEGYHGVVIGDRNYWSPRLAEDLASSGVMLCAPYKRIHQDPDPARSSLLGHLRRGIETVIGHLVERYHLKTVRARDLWHFSSRLWRKILSYTLAVWLNLLYGRPPLHLEVLGAT